MGARSLRRPVAQLARAERSLRRAMAVAEEASGRLDEAIRRNELGPELRRAVAGDRLAQARLERITRTVEGLRAQVGLPPLP